MKNLKLTTKITKIEKEIKKMNKDLENIRKKGFDERVISAQETALNEKKQHLETLTCQEKARLGHCDKDMFMTFSIVDDETRTETEKQYKVAFVKHNRPIDNSKVDGFISIIANNKYEKAFPIIAISATDAIANGYEVKDVGGHTVTKDAAEEFLVILDGQHRTLAFLKCCLTKKGVVPNTNLRDAKRIGEYLVDINDVGSGWSQKDRFAVAALTSDNELAQNIADRIAEKFNPTTASLIYTGKKISNKEVKKLLRGEDWTLPEGAKTDIARGDKFIELCKEAGIEVKFITKRYFISGFNAYAETEGDEEAFKKLDGLKALRLTEDMLREIKDGTQFEKMLREVA